MKLTMPIILKINFDIAAPFPEFEPENVHPFKAEQLLPKSRCGIPLIDMLHDLQNPRIDAKGPRTSVQHWNDDPPSNEHLFTSV